MRPDFRLIDVVNRIHTVIQALSGFTWEHVTISFNMPRPSKAKKRTQAAVNARMAKRKKQEIIVDSVEHENSELSDSDSESDSDGIIHGCSELNADHEDEYEVSSINLTWIDSALNRYRAIQTGESRANLYKKKAALHKAAQGTKKLYTHLHCDIK